MQTDPQRFENQKTVKQTNARQAALDETSRGMANEGCPNEPASSVPDATGYSGADDAAERS